MSEQSLHLFTPSEVAEELALRDAEMLRRITPEEIRDGAWMHEDKKAQLAPNVMTMVTAFNSLAHLVSSEVLAEETPQERAKVISAFIKIAKKCYELKNYNSLNALLAGLLSTPLYRLRKTWKEVPSKRTRQLSNLTCIMSDDNSWSQYKKDLSRQIKTNGRCIIFLGVFLSHVVRYESYHKLKRKSSSFSGTSTTPPVVQRKPSFYTVLDAITVQQRIESLRLSQPAAVGGCYSIPSGSLLDHALTLDIESSRSKNRPQHKHLSILTDALLDSNEGGEPCILSGTGLMNGERSSSDGDVSPDLCEGEWSKEVLCEVERRTRLRSQTPRHSVLRKGYSLDQILSVCDLEDGELEQSQSQSMSHLPSSSTLQQWAVDEFQLKSDLSTSRLTNGVGERNDSSSLQNGICVQENGLEEITNESDHPKTQHITRYTTSFSDSVLSTVSRPSRQTLPLLRKRHTASDEMHLLQLHIAKEEPTTDPAVLLKQYQLLSLGYSVTITSAPYIRTLLDHFKTTSDLEAYHYKRSYLLESF